MDKKRDTNTQQQNPSGTWKSNLAAREAELLELLACGSAGLQ